MSTRPQPQQLGIQGLGLDSGSWSWAQALPPEEVCHQEPALRGEMAEGMPPMQVGAAPAQRHGRAAGPWGRGAGCGHRRGAAAGARGPWRAAWGGGPGGRPGRAGRARAAGPARSPQPAPLAPRRPGPRAAKQQGPEAACRPGPAPAPEEAPRGGSPQRAGPGSWRSRGRVTARPGFAARSGRGRLRTEWPSGVHCRRSDGTGLPCCVASFHPVHRRIHFSLAPGVAGRRGHREVALPSFQWLANLAAR